MNNVIFNILHNIMIDLLKLFLLQIGHEPMSPYYYRTLLGEQRLILPNLITYGNKFLLFNLILITLTINENLVTFFTKM